MSKKKLLIVDDERAYARSLEFALKNDFHTKAAYSYKEAVNILKTEEIDAALLDVRLDENEETNKDGIRLLKWLVEARPDINCFVMTSYKEMGYKEEAIKIGAKHFFEKPIDIIQMRTILKDKTG